MTYLDVLDALHKYDVTYQLDRFWPTWYVPPAELMGVIAMLSSFLMDQKKLHVNGNTAWSINIAYHPGTGNFEVSLTSV